MRIRWVGLPSNAHSEYQDLLDMETKLRERMEKKRRHLQELVLQLIAFKNLVKLNESREVPEGSAIQLPFIVVSTDRNTVVDCQMTEDKWVLEE